MTQDELRAHVDHRASTPNGTIARRTIEDLPGRQKGAVVQDVKPMALAFIRASHGLACGCEYCTAG
jgi:hypothetical protein